MALLHDPRIPSVRPLVRLAPGIRLAAKDAAAPDRLLGLTAEHVHLNRHAVAILELCDGSRSRERVVLDAIMRAPGSLRASDVVDFLEAASNRGWIVEGE